MSIRSDRNFKATTQQYRATAEEQEMLEAYTKSRRQENDGLQLNRSVSSKLIRQGIPLYWEYTLFGECLMIRSFVQTPIFSVSPSSFSLQRL